MKSYQRSSAVALIYLHLSQCMMACGGLPDAGVAPKPGSAHRRDALGPPAGYALLATERAISADGGLRTPGTSPFTTGVTADGQSTVTIPLWVPPARLGFQPELALDYRSNRGDGFLGLGWAITGMSSIARCPKSPAIDGEGTWSAALVSETFCLDGLRLVAAGPGEFRTTPDSSQRLRRNQANDTWTVAFRDGSTRTYETRRATPTGTTYAWLITEARDAAQNQIQYFYGSEGELRTIKYGGNANGLVSKRSVTLGYQARANRLTHALGSDMSLRVASIEMSAPQGLTEAELPPSVARRYSLRYTTAGTTSGARDILKEVTECDKDGVCKEPIGIAATGALRFEYGAEQELMTTSASSIHALLLADLNGDGQQDIVYQVPGPTMKWVWLYRLQNPRGSATRFGVERSLGLEETSDSSPYPVFLDLDGDGAIDMLGPVPGGSLSGADSYYVVYRNETGASGSLPLFGRRALIPAQSALLTGRALIGDLDADGRPDIIDMDYWNLSSTSFGYPTLDLHVRWNESTPGNLSFGAPEPWLVQTCQPAGVLPGSSLTTACFTGGFGSPTTSNCTQCGAEEIVASAGDSQGATKVVVASAAQRPARGRFGVNRSGTGGYGLENFVLDLDADGVQELIYREAIDDFHEFRNANGGVVNPNPPAGLLSRVIRRARRLGNRNFVPEEVTRIPPVADQGLPSNISQSLIAELNGDGSPDLLMLSSNRTDFRLSDGRGSWGPNQKAPQPFGERIRVADFDADGRDEVLSLSDQRFYELDFSQSSVVVQRATFASDFGDDPDRNFVVGDVNTDTLTDLVYVRGSRVVSRIHEGRRPGLIDEVRQGRRAEFFEYGALGGDADYLAAPVCAAGQSCVKGGMFVVKTHSYLSTDPLVSGRTEINRAHYSYRDGRIDVFGGGWLGFGLVSRRDEQTGAVEEREFGVLPTDRLQCAAAGCLGRFTYPFSMTPRRVTQCLDLRETTSSSGRVLQSDTFATVNQHWLQIFPGSFMLRTSSTSADATEYDGAVAATTPAACAGVPLSTGRVTPLRSTHQFIGIAQGVPGEGSSAVWLGGFGPGRTIPASPPGGVVSQTFSTLLYPEDSTRWLFGLPRTVTTTSTEPGEAPVSRTVDYEFQPGSSLLSVEISMKGVAAGESDFELRKDYPRDRFGNVYAIQTSGSGAIRRTEVDFDSVEYAFPVRRRFFPRRSGVGVPPPLEVHSFFELSQGLLAASDDVNNQRTIRKYDAFGRLRSEVDPRSPTAQVSYQNNRGFFEVVRSELFSRPQGQSNLWRATVRVDMFGRAVRTTSLGWRGRSVVEANSYDRLGRLVTRSLPFFDGQTGSFIINSYDRAGRLTVVRNEATEDMVNTHFEGLTERTIDPRGFESRITRDAAGRVSASANLEGQREVRTTYGYGPFDTLRRVTDPLSRQRVLVWDALGRRTSLADPDSGTERARYNAFGEAKWVQDARNAIVETTFDGLGRPTARTLTPGGAGAAGLASNTESFEWDTAVNGKGYLSWATSMDGIVTTNTYTSRSQPLATKWSIPSHGDFTFTNFWDPNGRLTQLEYPDGFKASYEYDDSGAVANVFNLGAQTPRLFHVETVNAAGGITTEEFANETVTARSFDSTYRLTYQETSQRPPLGAAPPPAFQRLKYDYGRGGLLVARHDPTKQLSERFEHDFVGRLKEWRVVQTTGNVCRGGVTVYGYDDVGNLKSRTATGTGLSVSNTYGPQLGLAGGANALTSTQEGTGAPTNFSYDGAGNQERVFINRSPSSPTDAGDKHFAWTHFNLPRTLSDTVQGFVTTMRYDAMHRRVMRTSTAETVLTLAGLYEERTPGGANRTRVHNLVAGGRVVAQVTETGGMGQPVQSTAVYLHADLLGSPDAVTAGAPAQSVVVERAKYEPFGERRNADDVAQPQRVAHQRSLGFTGHEPDDFFGVTNMRGRLYDQRTGRFLSADPLVGAVTFGQSLNRYSYVLNSPLAFTDPSGFEVITLVVFGVTLAFASVWALAGTLLAIGGVLAGAISAIAAWVASATPSFAATPSGSPAGGTRAVDDSPKRQDWRDTTGGRRSTEQVAKAGNPKWRTPGSTLGCSSVRCLMPHPDGLPIQYDFPNTEVGWNDFQVGVTSTDRGMRQPELNEGMWEQIRQDRSWNVKLTADSALRPLGALGHTISVGKVNYVEMRTSGSIQRSGTGVVLDNYFQQMGVDASFGSVLWHEFGHDYGASMYKDGFFSNGPGSRIGSEAIRWERLFRALEGMQSLPDGAVHPPY